MQFYQTVIIILNFKLINIICVPQSPHRASKELSDQTVDTQKMHLVQLPNGELNANFDQHKSYGIFIPYAPSVKTSDIQVVPIVHQKDGFIIPIGSLRLPKTHIFDNLNIPITSTPKVQDSNGFEKVEEVKNQNTEIPVSSTKSDREVLIEFINRFHPDLTDKYIEDKAFDSDNYKNNNGGDVLQSTVEYYQLNTPWYEENTSNRKHFNSLEVTKPFEDQQIREPNIENKLPDGFFTSSFSPRYDNETNSQNNEIVSPKENLLQAVVRNITKNRNYLANLWKLSAPLKQALNEYRKQKNMRKNFQAFHHANFRPDFTNNLQIPIEIVKKQKHIFFNRQNSSANLFGNLPLSSPVKHAPRRSNPKNPQGSDLFNNFMTDFLHNNFLGNGTRNAATKYERRRPMSWCGCYRGCNDPEPKWKYNDYRKPFWRQLSLSAIYRCKFRKWFHDNAWYLKEMFKSLKNKTRFKKRKLGSLPDNVKSNLAPKADDVQNPGYVQVLPIEINGLSDSAVIGPNQGKFLPIYSIGDSKDQRALRGWARASEGRIPLGAFSAGKNQEGKTVYIARALYDDGKEHGLVPGMIVDEDRCVRFNWRGREICQTDYEVLIGAEFSWVVSHVKDFHPDRLVAGYEYDASRHLLICRKTILNSVVVTKLSASDGKCYASSAATRSVEFGFSEYELLVE